MRRIRELIIRIVNYLKAGDTQQACLLLSQILPTLEQLMQSLSETEQMEWMHIFESLMGNMEQQNWEGLAGVLQEGLLRKIDILCILCDDDEDVGAFVSRYEDIDCTNGIIFVFGLGNGMYIQELAKVCKEKAMLVIYEPIQEISQFISRAVDLGQFLDENRCMLFCDGIEVDEEHNIYAIQNFEEMLERMVGYSNRSQLYQAVLPQYKEICGVLYDQYCEQLQYRLLQVEMIALNNKTYGNLAIRNSYKMLSFLPDSCSCYSMKNIFSEDMPAVVVSAGPSLEKNIDLVEGIRDKALIVCVDSAVPYMMKRNILPHVIVTIDPRKYASYFEDERLQGITIVGGSDANADIIELVQPKKFVIAHSEDPYIQHMYEKVGKPLEYVEPGGCVSIFAFNFCKYIGIQRVIMIGLDLAFSGEKMYAGQDSASMEEMGYIKAAGNVEELVYTRSDYYHYKLWFEKYIRNHPDCQLINATEGGVVIKGCETDSLEHVISQYMLEEYELQGILDGVDFAFSEGEKEELRKQIEKKKIVFSELTRKLYRGKILAEKAMDMTIKTGNNNSSQFDKLNAEMQEILEYCDTSDEMFQVRRKMETLQNDLDTMVQVYADEGYGSTLREQYQKMKDFFGCMSKAAKAIEELYENGV